MQPSMQPQMQQQMQSGFNIMFTLNGNFAGNMYVTENMMFCEVVNYFSNNYQLKEEHGATFTFNSETLKADSGRKLSAIGIKNMSVIEVKTKIPINLPNNNSQNAQMNNNFQQMGTSPQGGMYGNMQGMGYMQMPMGFMPMGYMPQMTGNMPQMTGNMPQMTGNMHQMTGNMPQMTGNMPQMTANTVKTGNTGNAEYMNIVFNCNGGRTVLVQGTKSNKFSELSARFCVKSGMQESEISYLLNGQIIHPNKEKTLAQLNLHDQSKIDVVNTGNLVGAFIE